MSDEDISDSAEERIMMNILLDDTNNNISTSENVHRIAEEATISTNALTDDANNNISTSENVHRIAEEATTSTNALADDANNNISTTENYKTLNLFLTENVKIFKINRLEYNENINMDTLENNNNERTYILDAEIVDLNIRRKYKSYLKKISFKITKFTEEIGLIYYCYKNRARILSFFGYDMYVIKRRNTIAVGNITVREAGA
ncbi:hypothetical protein B5S27_g2839 [[Candida] boidinii]|nr:hypothetical protein B5S27_g2839 [[Candida] boidinii]